ncbi:Anthocyanin 5-aromatic acyltransferase [Morus notabilis]|uniref:Anthocyanin 5-aromatic acyltransferase n=1 Tax=Morus notabilis TaxID=981085 RepID=W9R889_9ROSA|nr:coumaroyl-CoA:anthocyanidin 3-O-glucoside-6''-O-coumaroyltransferase 1 [Morus notabilis]EXB62318.1 Anthocyanin 5-aromatic acyltransferase [Morus notabilis]
MQSVYVYEFPHSTHHFLKTVLLTLKHSLSLTLQHFFPFAANLVCPPPPAKPHILFTDGESSVSFTVVESAAYFDFFLGNHPRPVGELHPFIPKLQAPTRAEGGSRVGPLMALQVTVFPNSGICIGFRFCHVAADGRSFDNFMKSWALVCKSGGDFGPGLQLPSHDRAAIKDPDAVELKFLERWWSWASTLEDREDARPVVDCRADYVRATFVLSQAQIERLKRLVRNQLAKDENSTPFNVSSFVVSSALIWFCLAKSEEITERNNSSVNEDDEPYYIIFGADCRSRLEFPLPTTYFGNCLRMCFVPVTKKELSGEKGVVAAAKAIGKEVGRLKSEALKEFDEWFVKHGEATKRGKHFAVEGSTNLSVYEADFGWGKPKKCNLVHIEESNAISLVESRDEKGGVEFSFALSRNRMTRFSAIFEEMLSQFI